jgi:CRISPR-associated protein Cas6
MADDDFAAPVVDVAFAVVAGRLSGEYRRALADAVEAALPWLATAPLVGLHPVKAARDGGAELLLSQRTRLVLRVPRDRAVDAEALAGRELRIGDDWLRLGAAQRRELLAWGTLFSHCVAARADDELAFLGAVQAELDALGVVGRPICGLPRRGAAGELRGYGLMVDRLTPQDSLLLQAHGIGAGRRFGYGLFVPHKSAAAVGAAV